MAPPPRPPHRRQEHRSRPPAGACNRRRDRYKTNDECQEHDNVHELLIHDASSYEAVVETFEVSATSKV